MEDRQLAQDQSRVISLENTPSKWYAQKAGSPQTLLTIRTWWTSVDTCVCLESVPLPANPELSPTLQMCAVSGPRHPSISLGPLKSEQGEQHLMEEPITPGE